MKLLIVFVITTFVVVLNALEFKSNGFKFAKGKRYFDMTRNGMNWKKQIKTLVSVFQLFIR